MGGPVLINGAKGASLVGVIVGQIKGANFTEERQGDYGSVAVFERIAPYLKWLKEVIETHNGLNR